MPREDTGIFSQDAERPRVLVIDDDPVTIAVVRQILERLGWEVRSTTSGMGVRSQLLGDPPALILLDIDMPGLSGLSVAKLIRSDSRFDSVGLMLFSGRPEGELERLARDTKATGYVAKGATPALMAASIGQRVGRAGRYDVA